MTSIVITLLALVGLVALAVAGLAPLIQDETPLLPRREEGRMRP